MAVKPVRKRETSSAEVREGHFLLVFACEASLNLPRWSHTFAIFARAAKGESLRHHIISWLPITLDIDVLGEPVVGKNFDIKATLDWIKRSGATITAWGPFQIEQELFESALTRIASLGTGNIKYVLLDGNYRPDKATNCIHALSDLGLTTRSLDTGIAYGERASLMVIQYFKQWIIDPSRTHPWVIEELGLNEHDITFKKLTSSESSHP